VLERGLVELSTRQTGRHSLPLVPLKCPKRLEASEERLVRRGTALLFPVRPLPSPHLRFEARRKPALRSAWLPRGQ
jgi:hypothetical protein